MASCRIKPIRNNSITAENVADRSHVSRRGWIALSAASATAVLAGCRDSSTDAESSVASAVRSDIPLRIVWTGDASEAEIVRRTWASINDQPLEIQTVARLEADWDRAGQADVLVYSLNQLSEMVSRELLMPLLTSTDQSETERSDNPSSPLSISSLEPAKRVAITFGGRSRGIPLSGALPALLRSEIDGEANDPSEEQPLTWSEYDQLAKDYPGKVAEPTAEGWAGTMFLWRLASSLETTWLFDRDSLEPLLTRSEYVDVLRQMVTTVKNGPQRPMTPGEIFRGVATGELMAGIGFPRVEDAASETASAETESIGNVRIMSLPITQSRVSNDTSVLSERMGRIMLPPTALVGSLAASCRQTAAATNFLEWLAGGEGSEPLYRSIGGLMNASGGTTVDESAGGNYRRWVQSAWQNPNVLPPVSLLDSDQYLRALDEQIRQCLAGEVTAEAACDSIANAWSQLHQSVGLKKQQRTWQRALGLM